jgi:hypothetical protein
MKNSINDDKPKSKLKVTHDYLGNFSRKHIGRELQGPRQQQSERAVIKLDANHYQQLSAIRRGQKYELSLASMGAWLTVFRAAGKKIKQPKFEFILVCFWPQICSVHSCYECARCKPYFSYFPSCSLTVFPGVFF